jgi:MerR family transcriptional regulator/heat shock protein HspR
VSDQFARPQGERSPGERLQGESTDEPCYIISVAAKLVQMHPQTLRYYERLGLIRPARSDGKIRLYSARDIDRLRQIHKYIDDLGVNLAGVEVILRMTERMAQIEQQMLRVQAQLLSEVRRLRQALGESVGDEATEAAVPRSVAPSDLASPDPAEPDL